MIWFTRSIRDLEADLVEVEAKISLLRCEQVVLVGQLDTAQAPQADGSRSLVDWVSARLDMNRRTARDLVFAARTFHDHRGLHRRMIDGGESFDRTVAVVKLAETEASEDVVAGSYDHDLDGVRRLTNRTRHVTSVNERDAFSGRFFTIQPNLDETTYRMWGEAPGIVGRTIEKAICDRADEIHRGNTQSSSLGQRQLDALESLALDSLDRRNTSSSDNAGRTSSSVPHVTVFVDARQDNPVETATEIEYGQRIGPDALEELLCTGSVQVVGLDTEGVPVVTSRSSRAIPPAVRHHVAHRDKACLIDGCRSSYRLQPHHITRFADGGDHDPDNLVTLCWFHHHIAVHRRGFHIDPTSPRHRRRLLQPTRPPPR